MTEERFFSKVREDAQTLRYEPDDFMIARVSARVRERIAAQPSVAGILARWFRPLATSMAAIALAAALGLAWMSHTAQTNTTSVESLASNNPVEISIGGDVYSVNQ